MNFVEAMVACIREEPSVSEFMFNLLMQFKNLLHTWFKELFFKQFPSAVLILHKMSQEILQTHISPFSFSHCTEMRAFRFLSETPHNCYSEECTNLS